VTYINWSTWAPREKATLGFIRQGGRVLLIRKKRGLGAGKINGFGGKLEAEELPLAAMQREAEEELRIQVVDPVPVGELNFQFTDGYSLSCTVFLITQFTGEPTATAEADPLWFSISNLPFDEMWADDRLWLRQALDGKRFRGFFAFSGDTMLSQFIEWL